MCHCWLIDRGVSVEVPVVDLAVLVPSLFGFPLDGTPASNLADGVRQLDSLEAQVVARRAEYLAQVERAEVARQEGFGSTTSWLMAVSGDPAPVCRSRLAVAAALEEMPETREAFARLRGCVGSGCLMGLAGMPG